MFSITTYPNASVVSVGRDFDIATADGLATALDHLDADSRKDYVIVTLEDCSFCDSSGLGALIRAKKRLSERLLVVVPKATQIRRVMEMTRLIEVLQPYESVDLALAAIRLEA